MKQSLAPSGRPGFAIIRRLARAAAVLAVLACAANVALYIVTEAWQYVGAAAVFAATLVAIWRVEWLNGQGRTRVAAVWMFAVPIALVPIASLLWEGLAPALALATFGIGSLLASWLFPPEKRFLPLLISVLVAIAIWLTRSLPLPWDRYDVSGFEVTALASVVLIAMTSAAVIWQIAVEYRRLVAIRARLVATFVALVIGVALAVSLTSILLGINTTQQRTFDQLNTAVILKSRAVDTWLDQLRYALDSVIVEDYGVENLQSILSGGPAVEDVSISGTAELRERFSDLIALTGWFTEIFIVDTDGEVVLSTDPSAEGRIVANQPYFEEGLKAYYVDPPRYDPLQDGITIVVARPLQLDGLAYGLLVARTGMAQLNTIASTGQIGETGTTDFVSVDRILLTGSSVAGGYIPVSSDAIETALNRIMGIRRAVYLSHRGVRVSGAYMWLPRLQVAMLMELEQREVLAGAIATSVANAGVAFLAALVAVTLAIGFAKSISRPLSSLATTASLIAAGDLDLTAEVSRDDEIGAVARSFNAMTSQLRDLIGSLEARVAERTRGLQAVADVSRATTSLLDLDSLLPEVVELAKQRFGLYYVGLFLLDRQEENAVLRAGTGEAGREMVAQGWSLEVGGQSMIGQCMATGEAVISQQGGDDVVRFENPWLPETRSELALPLRYGGRTTGAMTVQSVEPGAFDDTAIAVLQNLADQVAVAVENARLFAETQAALDRVRRAQRRYERQSWSEYLRSVPHDGGGIVTGYERRGDDLQPLSSSWNPLPKVEPTDLRAALASGEPVELGGREDVEPQILVPIVQAGEVIGTLGVRREVDWSDEDVALVRNLAEQLSLAAENQRLLDVTRRREAVERLTRELATRMRRSLDIGQVLRSAVHGFADAFDADEVTVRLVPPDAASPEGATERSGGVSDPEGSLLQLPEAAGDGPTSPHQPVEPFPGDERS